MIIGCLCSLITKNITINDLSSRKVIHRLTRSLCSTKYKHHWTEFNSYDIWGLLKCTKRTSDLLLSFYSGDEWSSDSADDECDALIDEEVDIRSLPISSLLSWSTAPFRHFTQQPWLSSLDDSKYMLPHRTHSSWGSPVGRTWRRYI